MQAESGLMRKYTLRFIFSITTPEGQSYQIVMFSNRNNGQTIEPMSDTYKVASLQVILEIGTIVAVLLSLFRSEVATLLSRQGGELPICCFGVPIGHA